MRKCDAVAHIVEHEHDTSIEYSVDPTAPTASEMNGLFGVNYMLRRCFVTCVLLFIGCGCCPSQQQSLDRQLQEASEIRDCLEKGVPLLATQLRNRQGPPDRVVEWRELHALLKNEAGLPDDEVVAQMQQISVYIERIRHIYLRDIDGDITTKCKLLLYDWQHPFEYCVLIDGLWPKRAKGTYSTYYVEYNGQIIKSELIHRLKPEHGA